MVHPRQSPQNQAAEMEASLKELDYRKRSEWRDPLTKTRTYADTPPVAAGMERIEKSTVNTVWLSFLNRRGRRAVDGPAITKHSRTNY